MTSPTTRAGKDTGKEDGTLRRIDKIYSWEKVATGKHKATAMKPACP